MREDKTASPTHRHSDGDPATAPVVRAVGSAVNARSGDQPDVQAAIDSSPRQSAQRQQLRSLFGAVAQLQEAASPPPPNRTGLPNELKAGIESLSGLSMDHVKVHYNSSQPAQLNALAYAQGNDIHLGPGQEQHLPHEAWHVAQQQQGRVPATMQMAGVGVNDDPGLETEADLMGAKAAAMDPPERTLAAIRSAQTQIDRAAPAPVQRRIIGDTSELSASEAREQKQRLSQEKGEVSELQGPVDPAGVTFLRTALVEAARALIAEYNTTRDTKVDIGPGTDYHKLLSLAVGKVMRKYGLVLKEAASAILGNAPQTLKLHHADTRWDEIRKNHDEVASEARLAAQYLLDTNERVQGAIQKIEQQHNKDNPLSVEQAYLGALYSDPDQSWLLALAECRVRWAPLTLGSDIYIAPPKQYSKNYFDTWTQYKYLVHEVLHTAAHPNFVKYIEEEAPPGSSNVILEGAVDFFAQSVWTDIINELQPDVESADVQTVQAIQGNKKSIPKALLATLKEWAPKPLYTLQVPQIERGVKELDNGANRLKAAFFYGDVYHFFPRFNQDQSVGKQEEAPIDPLYGFPGYQDSKAQLDASMKHIFATKKGSIEGLEAEVRFTEQYQVFLTLVPNILTTGTREQKESLQSVLVSYRQFLIGLKDNAAGPSSAGGPQIVQLMPADAIKLGLWYRIQDVPGPKYLKSRRHPTGADPSWEFYTHSLGMAKGEAPLVIKDADKILAVVPGPSTEDVQEWGRGVSDHKIFGLDKKNTAAVKKAIEVGYRCFDAAKTYSFGVAELAALCQQANLARTDYKVVYKVGRAVTTIPLAEVIAEALGHLGYIDVLMVHESTPQLAENIRTINHYISTGLVKAGGLSNVAGYDLEGLEVADLKHMIMLQDSLDIIKSAELIGPEMRAKGKLEAVGVKVKDTAYGLYLGIQFTAPEVEQLKTLGVSAAEARAIWASHHGFGEVASSNTPESITENFQTPRVQATVAATIVGLVDKKLSQPAADVTAQAPRKWKNEFLRKIYQAAVNNAQSNDLDAFLDALVKIGEESKMTKLLQKGVFQLQLQSSDVTTNNIYKNITWTTLFSRDPSLEAAACNKRELLLAIATSVEKSDEEQS